jgi:hypothetical protein
MRMHIFDFSEISQAIITLKKEEKGICIVGGLVVRLVKGVSDQ